MFRKSPRRTPALLAANRRNAWKSTRGGASSTPSGFCPAGAPPSRPAAFPRASVKASPLHSGRLDEPGARGQSPAALLQPDVPPAGARRAGLVGDHFSVSELGTRPRRPAAMLMGETAAGRSPRNEARRAALSGIAPWVRWRPRLHARVCVRTTDPETYERSRNVTEMKRLAKMSAVQEQTQSHPGTHQLRYR
jgi:hypothetical protein